MPPVPPPAPPPAKVQTAEHRRAPVQAQQIPLRSANGQYALQFSDGKATLLASQGQVGSAAACRDLAVKNAPDLAAYRARAQIQASSDLASTAKAFLPELTPEERSKLTAFTVIDERASGAKDYTTYISETVAKRPGRCVAADTHELFHIFLEQSRGALPKEYSELLAYDLSVERLAGVTTQWKQSRPEDVTELQAAVSRQEAELGKLIRARGNELEGERLALKGVTSGFARQTRAAALDRGLAELGTIRARQAARLGR